MREVRWERMFPDGLEAAFAVCSAVNFAYGAGRLGLARELAEHP